MVRSILIRRRTLLFSALAYVPAGRLLWAQESQPAQASRPSEKPTFSTDVKVVNVFANVRDKDGHIVTDLTKDDFTLLEDGRPQTIRYFAQQSDLPLTIGLLVDTSMSERRMLPEERKASYAFLEQVLRPEKDKAFLIHFDREIELLQDLTSSRERLEKALDQLGKPQFGSANDDPDKSGSGGGNGGGWPNGGGGGGRGGGQRRGGGGTAFYDAIYLASDEIMKKQSGRKALIMLTDGEDNASKISLEEAISSANRADTMGYAVRIADEEQPAFNRGFGGPGMGRHGGGGWPGGGGGGWPGGGGRGGGMNRPDGKKILKQISRETGGSYFEVSKKKSVDDIYASIQEELRHQYSIGYTSDNSTGGSNFRKIELTVKKKGLTVQARDGYYPGTSKV